MIAFHSLCPEVTECELRCVHLGVGVAVPRDMRDIDADAHRLLLAALPRIVPSRGVSTLQ